MIKYRRGPFLQALLNFAWMMIIWLMTTIGLLGRMKLNDYIFLTMFIYLIAAVTNAIAFRFRLSWFRSRLRLLHKGQNSLTEKYVGRFAEGAELNTASTDLKEKS